MDRDGRAPIVPPGTPPPPRKYQQHASRIGGTSSGFGRGSKGFWNKVRIVGESPGACWEWLGYLDKDGYGKFVTTRALDGSKYPRPRTLRPHRALYEFDTGEALGAGVVLMHFCDNARCVNPEHVRPGTQADNMRDMDAKGRRGVPPDNRGELSPTAILTADNVREMRAYRGIYGAAPLLARLFGVSVHTAHQVLEGRTWKHITGRYEEPLPLRLLADLIEQREASLSRRGAA